MNEYYPCLSAVSLQYICSVSAVSTACALDRPAVHKGYHLRYHFVLKYPLKCSEVCFEVQRSAYFAALGLHCRRTWVSSIWEFSAMPAIPENISAIPADCRKVGNFGKSAENAGIAESQHFRYLLTVHWKCHNCQEFPDPGYV